MLHPDRLTAYRRDGRALGDHLPLARRLKHQLGRRCLGPLPPRRRRCGRRCAPNAAQQQHEGEPHGGGKDERPGPPRRPEPPAPRAGAGAGAAAAWSWREPHRSSPPCCWCACRRVGGGVVGSRQLLWTTTCLNTRAMLDQRGLVDCLEGRIDSTGWLQAPLQTIACRCVDRSIDRWRDRSKPRGQQSIKSAAQEIERGPASFDFVSRLLPAVVVRVRKAERTSCLRLDPSLIFLF